MLKDLYNVLSKEKETHIWCETTEMFLMPQELNSELFVSVEVSKDSKEYTIIVKEVINND